VFRDCHAPCTLCKPLLGILIRCRSILTYPKSSFVLVGGNSQKAIELIKVGGYILLIDETFIVKLFSTTKKKHECVVQTRVCIFSLECYANRRTNIISIINAFYFFVFSSLIVYGTACLNSQLNWTCPGGYLRMVKARWETNVICGSVYEHKEYDVKTNLENKCNNKSACHFTVENSSFDAICTDKCESFQLDFGYRYVSKSFASRFLFIIFSPI
jgi:hypothetical protein